MAQSRDEPRQQRGQDRVFQVDGGRIGLLGGFWHGRASVFSFFRSLKQLRIVALNSRQVKGDIVGWYRGEPRSGSCTGLTTAEPPQ